jgi:hypothetical protein
MRTSISLLCNPWLDSKLDPQEAVYLSDRFLESQAVIRQYVGPGKTEGPFNSHALVVTLASKIDL